MSVNGVGSRSFLTVQRLVDMRRQLDELQRQLGTGQRAETYAGLGIERGLTVGLRTHLSLTAGFTDTINNVGVRLALAQTVLSRMSEVSHDVKAATVQSPFDVDAGGQTISQKLALGGLGEVLALLNTQAGDRYLFSGLSAEKSAVESLDHILDGEGTRAGFRQVMAERRLADLGATGLGRLVITAPTATSVSIAEDVAPAPFGFKLTAVNAGLSGATVNGPTGSPPAVTVDLAANPNAGESIEFRFALPDGSSESITLTATTSATPGPNQFTIGATPDVTAANLQATLTASVAKLAGTSLTAASALAAARDFFAVDDANPPRRVAGPPFDTATALVAGTPADTVTWYTGEAGATAARSTAMARVDQAITVSYGLRANEEGIRWVVQNMAALAAMSYAPNDPDAAERNAALNQRITAALSGPAGVQKIENIAADLAGAQKTIEDSKDRHRQTTSALTDLLQEIEGVPTEDVAAQILALQARLQASLQTTAMLYQTSLVYYL